MVLTFNLFWTTLPPIHCPPSQETQVEHLPKVELDAGFTTCLTTVHFFVALEALLYLTGKNVIKMFEFF